jgi:hypothetical protein
LLLRLSESLLVTLRAYTSSAFLLVPPYRLRWRGCCRPFTPLPVLPTAVVSAVDPLARSSALRVNRGRNGFLCGSVELAIRRWVNIIAHRYRSRLAEILRDSQPPRQYLLSLFNEGMILAASLVATISSSDSQYIPQMSDSLSHANELGTAVCGELERAEMLTAKHIHGLT